MISFFSFYFLFYLPNFLLDVVNQDLTEYDFALFYKKEKSCWLF